MSHLPTPLLSDTGRISLCEVLDRVINKGAVATAGITISIANVDLLYLDLHLLLCSAATLYATPVPVTATGDE